MKNVMIILVVLVCVGVCERLYLLNPFFAGRPGGRCEGFSKNRYPSERPAAVAVKVQIENFARLSMCIFFSTRQLIGPACICNYLTYNVLRKRIEWCK